jgi:hypothetical protein
MATILARSQTPLFSLFYRHFEPFSLPKTKDTRLPRPPSFPTKEPADTSIPKSRKRPRQLKHPLHQRAFILTRLPLESLTAPRLAENLARPSLGDAELPAKHDDRRSFPGRAYQFPSARCLSI